MQVVYKSKNARREKGQLASPAGKDGKKSGGTVDAITIHEVDGRAGEAQESRAAYIAFCRAIKTSTNRLEINQFRFIGEIRIFYRP
jgi:hypothetical protein